MWRVALADLRYRRRRFVIAVLATAIAFAMSLLMAGVVEHLRNETDRVVALFDADRFVVAEGGTGPFTATRLLPAAVADELRADPGVGRAEPFAQARETLKGLDVNVLGLVPGGLGWPTPADGRPPTGPGEAVVDRRLGYDVGDVLRLGALEVAVVGVSEGTTYYFGGPTVFLVLEDLQRTFLEGRPLATAVAVQGVPTAAPSGTTVLDVAAVVDDLNRPQEPALRTVALLDLLLWLMAAGVVASMVYLSVLEGTRDIAVQKAVGVTTRTLFASVAVQGLVLALMACAVGAVVAAALAPAFPMAVETPTSAYVTVLAASVAIGLAAAVVAVRRAASVDPALAFGR